MMGMPLPINMIFPKIQEGFKELIEKGEMLGLSMHVEKDGFLICSKDESLLITPEMEYDEILNKVGELREAVENGK